RCEAGRRGEDQARGGRIGPEDPAAPAQTGGNPRVPRQVRLDRRSRRHANRRVILVDSSVWIDYFRGAPTPETDRLDALLGSESLAVGDLILAEVLQGFTS